MYGIFFFYAVGLNSGSMQSGCKCTQWGEISFKILIFIHPSFCEIFVTQYSCPERLNSQSTFWKTNFNFGNARTFLYMVQKVKFTNKKLILVQSKFWHFQIEIGLPKHRLEIQKFRL